jgi:hypothetical protein
VILTKPQMLANGYQVLAYVKDNTGDCGTVLVVHDQISGGKEWITWEVGPDGNCYQGHYLIEKVGKDISDAWADFFTRCLRRVPYTAQ